MRAIRAIRAGAPKFPRGCTRARTVRAVRAVGITLAVFIAAAVLAKIMLAFYFKLLVAAWLLPGTDAVVALDTAISRIERRRRIGWARGGDGGRRLR